MLFLESTEGRPRSAGLARAGGCARTGRGKGREKGREWVRKGKGQGWWQCLDSSAGEGWGQAGKVTRMGRQWARDREQ